jgi:tRNA pseudouridine38-40 synthase
MKLTYRPLHLAMARYKLTLAYDGTAFFGSQRQAHRRTVQSEIEKAARRLGWKGSSLVLAGRTDSGVHATGQVAALDLDWNHAPDSLRDALNAWLPGDLAVIDASQVDDAFHPRFDAVSRRYRYDVRCAPLRHPLEDRMAWRVWPPVRLADLNRIARLVLGKHEFGAFGSAARKGGGTSRTVTVSQWTSEDGFCRYHVAADGFLYRMVRRLVFLQIAVGHGKCSERVFRDALEIGRRVLGLPAGTAPAEGLRLLEVRY